MKLSHKARGEQRLSAKIIRPEILLRYGKLLVFGLLFTVCVVVAAVNREVAPFYAIWIIVAAEAVLLIENAVKMWALRKWSHKITCYVLDSLLLLVLTYFTDGFFISTLYVIILSEFYLTQEKFSSSVVMGVCSVVLFLVMFGVSNALKNESLDV